jgi:DNA-directed RNA polymerase specialized sigma24 family protein
MDLTGDRRAERPAIEAMDFPDLIRRVRSGDEAASTELERLFKPFLMRIARFRLRECGNFAALRREFSSSDICQSVFRSLFLGLKGHRFRFDEPEDLRKLLGTMVRFSVATKAGRSSANLRKVLEDFDGQVWVDRSPGPDEKVADRDLVDAVLRRFSGVELEILLMRLDDEPWAEVGRKLGRTADAVRIQMNRAVERVKAGGFQEL